MKKPLTQDPSSKNAMEKPSVSKKDFRESPFVEQFYKTMSDHKLRELAYKTAIEVYLSRKK